MSLLVKGYLHSDYGIYEEKHSNKKTDVRKSLLEKRQQRQLIIDHLLFKKSYHSTCMR